MKVWPFAFPTALGGIVLCLMEGGADDVECRFQFRHRKQAKAEAKYARLLAEPAAVADPSVEACQHGVETCHCRIVEAIAAEPDAAERAGVRGHPLDQRGIALDPGGGTRESSGQMPAALGGDAPGLAQHAQPECLINGRVGDDRIELAKD